MRAQARHQTGSKFPRLGHDVDDNKSSYQYFPSRDQEVKLLILKMLIRLHRWRAPEKGNQKMKANPAMFMKTKTEKSDTLCHATMLMKTNVHTGRHATMLMKAKLDSSIHGMGNYLNRAAPIRGGRL